ncbi:12831_t:CDS:2 [Cetraspora pellucida]|uniref:12831_t:CDS:1 n=1 Tax=Cetraspora pellucida TaxID=1433469 RepID=A0A9N9I211_9GLOM|nr:12831_t:CDS:2 [Cetraspora pellucida]
MAYISESECSEAGILYVLRTSSTAEETSVTAEEILKKHPELLELYENLNNFSTNLPQSRTMPNGYQSLIDNCLEENHYDAALDLLESCQSQHYHPPEQHIRRLMDIIASDQVDDDIASRAYKVLQHILQTSSNEAFQYIWTSERIDADEGTLWENYVNFWKFIENRFTSLIKVNKDKHERIIMILDHIVNVIEIDIKVKKDQLNSSLLLQLIPKSYGRIRTNIKDPINVLLFPFREEVSIEIARLSQRLLKQTILSNTFKCMLLDLALRDTDLSLVPRQNRNMVNSPLSLVKFVNIYFDSKPYSNKNNPIAMALWRHIFILCSAFQSYINSKTMRVGHKVFCGLDDEERKLIIDKVIIQRVNELMKRLEDQKMNSELKKNTKFLLEIMNIDIERIYGWCLENSSG